MSSGWSAYAQGDSRARPLVFRDYANYPTLFTQNRQPDTDYLAIPEVSSETREYIPIAMLPPSVVASNKLQIVPGAPIHYFGILTSAMHMAWMRTVGRAAQERLQLLAFRLQIVPVARHDGISEKSDCGAVPSRCRCTSHVPTIVLKCAL